MKLQHVYRRKYKDKKPTILCGIWLRAESERGSVANRGPPNRPLLRGSSAAIAAVRDNVKDEPTVSYRGVRNIKTLMESPCSVFSRILKCSRTKYIYLIDCFPKTSRYCISPCLTSINRIAASGALRIFTFMTFTFITFLSNHYTTICTGIAAQP